MKLQIKVVQWRGGHLAQEADVELIFTIFLEKLLRRYEYYGFYNLIAIYDNLRVTNVEVTRGCTEECDFYRHSLL